MMSVGGIFGAIMAAILTENFNPAYSFMGTAVIGFFLGIGCLFLDKEIELVDTSEKTKSVWTNLKSNFSEIIQALKIKEFYGVLIF
jgi:MFS-type transporter involved in bile tolerance (Atg22 family)